MIHPSQQRSSLARRNAGTRVTISRGDTTRSFHIRPAATALAFGFVVMLAIVYLAGTAYLIYRDDLLGGALARQVGMQHAYEDRIAALRAEIDRVTSRHVVARKGIGDQVAMLLERQALIGERQQDLEAISVSAERAGINVADALAPLPRSRPVIAAGRPANVGTPALAYAAASESGADIITGSLIRGSAHEAQPDIKPLLSAVAGELDHAERLQSETLDALSAAAAARADKLSSALAPLGVAPETVRDPVPPTAPQGGPFIPAGNLHFVEKLSLLSRSLSGVAALRLQADALPLRQPIPAARFSSRFGTRNDPFLNRPAFHAGLDFVAATGTEVRAAGAGTIVSANWSGGYGQLVEIRHAGGVTTRYGHLSAILVRPGERVAAGTPIGLVGSTGRSTGPHLHYETRRGGEPVDPAFFLAAGRAL